MPKTVEFLKLLYEAAKLTALIALVLSSSGHQQRINHLERSFEYIRGGGSSAGSIWPLNEKWENYITIVYSYDSPLREDSPMPGKLCGANNRNGQCKLSAGHNGRHDFQNQTKLVGYNKRNALGFL